MLPQIRLRVLVQSTMLDSLSLTGQTGCFDRGRARTRGLSEPSNRVGPDGAVDRNSTAPDQRTNTVTNLSCMSRHASASVRKRRSAVRLPRSE